MPENASMDSYYGQVDSSFYAGPKGTDFQIRTEYPNYTALLAGDTINNLLIGDYVSVNYRLNGDDQYEYNKQIDAGNYGYQNATIWKKVDITSTPTLNYHCLFQTTSDIPDIAVTSSPTLPSVNPSASVSGPIDNKTIHFNLPRTWDIDVTSSSVNPSVSPSATVNKSSNTTATINLSLPKMWDITASHTVVNAGVNPSVTMSKTGATANITFSLPKMWNIDATVIPTSGIASVSVTGNTATKTFSFALPVVDGTCVNPNLVYNPWFTVNSRGYEQYIGAYCDDILNSNDILNNSITYTRTTDIPGKIHWINSPNDVSSFDEDDYTVDSWQVIYTAGSRDPGHTIVEKNIDEPGIKLIHLNPYLTVDKTDNQFGSAGIICFLDNPELLIDKTVTLTVEYKDYTAATPTFTIVSATDRIKVKPSASNQVSCSCIINEFQGDYNGLHASTAKIITTYQGYVGVLLQTKTNTTTEFKRVKVEIGGYSTLQYDIEPNYYEEYNRCIHRFIESPSNYSDDYARVPVDPVLSVFNLTSDKVSSLYEIGMTYFDHANEIYYDGQTTSTGSILNQDDENIILDNNKSPMVCASFAQLMLAGIPYEQSRITTGQKNNGELIGGTNIPYSGKSCFAMYSPIIKNYWGRYPSTKQLYSSTFAKLLYDAGLLHEIKDGSEIRPGDIIFFNSARQYASQYNEWSQSTTYSKDNIIQYKPTANVDLKYYKSQKNNNTNITPGSNSTYWQEIQPLNYRRWDAMQHVELFLGWYTENSQIKGQALCVSSALNPPLGYRVFYYPDTLESDTARLKWYARLSAGSGIEPVNLFEQQQIGESSSSTEFSSLPYEWSTSSTEQWKYIPLDEGKHPNDNTAFTIIFETQQDSTDTIWRFKFYIASGWSSQHDFQSDVLCNNKCFKVGPNLYSCVIRTKKHPTSSTIIKGLAVTPINNNSESAILKHIWVYDKLVAP